MSFVGRPAGRLVGTGLDHEYVLYGTFEVTAGYVNYTDDFEDVKDDMVRVMPGDIVIWRSNTDDDSSPNPPVELVCSVVKVLEDNYIRPIPVRPNRTFAYVPVKKTYCFWLKHRNDVFFALDVDIRKPTIPPDLSSAQVFANPYSIYSTD